MSSFEPHFQHRQSAHCESGVMASLLSHAGLPMSEPMAFGLASGLAFAYLPIVKLSGMPLIAYRMPPKHLIKTLSKRLGARLNSRTFGNPEQGRRELEGVVINGKTKRDTFTFVYMKGDSLALSDREGRIQGFHRSLNAMKANAKAHAAAEKLNSKMKKEILK